MTEQHQAGVSRDSLQAAERLGVGRKPPSALSKQKTKMQMAMQITRKEVHTKMAGAAAKSCLRFIPIIDPRGIMRKCWDVCLMLVMLFNLIEAPIRLCFEMEPGDTLVTIATVADAFLICDIIINFRTGYYQDAVLEVDPLLIATRYFTGRFLVDFITSIPFSLFGDSMAIKALRLLKVLRLPQIYYVLKHLDRSGGKFTTFADTIAAVLGLLLCAHFSSCIWNLIARYDRLHNPLYANESWESRYCGDNSHCDLYDRWRNGLYFAVVTLSSTGFGDILPVSDLERNFTLIMLCGGGMIYGYVLTVSMSLFMPTKADKDFEDHMQELLAYLHQSKLPKWLRNKVVAYYEYTWSHRTAEVEKKVLDGLPPILRSTCSRYCYKDVIESVPFLRNMGEECVSELVTRFTFMHCNAGEYVFQKGSVGKALFIVKNGQLEVLADPNDPAKGGIAFLFPGDLFGEAVVSKAPSIRAASVRAVVRSYLLRLNKEDFHNVMDMFPEVLSIVANLKNERLKEMEEAQIEERQQVGILKNSLKNSKRHWSKAKGLSFLLVATGEPDNKVTPVGRISVKEAIPQDTVPQSADGMLSIKSRNVQGDVVSNVIEIKQKLLSLINEQEKVELERAAKEKMFVERMKEIEELLESMQSKAE